MPLEEALNRNTEMLERLCSIMGSVPFRAPDPLTQLMGGQLAHETQKPQGQWTAEESAATAARQATQSPNGNSPPANDDEAREQIEAEKTSSPALDYVKHVKPITLRLSKEKGRDVTIAVLQRFGVKGAQELDAGQWKEYIGHCEKVLAGGDV